MCHGTHDVQLEYEKLKASIHRFSPFVYRWHCLAASPCIIILSWFYGTSWSVRASVCSSNYFKHFYTQSEAVKSWRSRGEARGPVYGWLSNSFIRFSAFWLLLWCESNMKASLQHLPISMVVNAPVQRREVVWSVSTQLVVVHWWWHHCSTVQHACPHWLIFRLEGWRITLWLKKTLIV